MAQFETPTNNAIQKNEKIVGSSAAENQSLALPPAKSLSGSLDAVLPECVKNAVGKRRLSREQNRASDFSATTMSTGKMLVETAKQAGISNIYGAAASALSIANGPSINTVVGLPKSMTEATSSVNDLVQHPNGYTAVDAAIKVSSAGIGLVKTAALSNPATLAATTVGQSYLSAARDNKVVQNTGGAILDFVTLKDLRENAESAGEVTANAVKWISKPVVEPVKALGGTLVDGTIETGDRIGNALGDLGDYAKKAWKKVVPGSSTQKK